MLRGVGMSVKLPYTVRPGAAPFFPELLMRQAAPTILLTILAACGNGSDGSSSASCGIAAMASPASLLSQFGVPRQTLAQPPAELPERLVVRAAGGSAFSAVVGRGASDSLLLIGVEGSPGTMALGFGVLVTDQQGVPRGVMLFEGLPVEAAPRIGTVSMGSMSAPLLGVEADPEAYEDPACPLFPASALQ